MFAQSGFFEIQLTLELPADPLTDNPLLPEANKFGMLCGQEFQP